MTQEGKTMHLNNLDAEKGCARVLVFDESQAFVTEYEESIHLFGIAAGDAGRKRTEDELRRKLAATAYACGGNTLVAIGDDLPKPMIYKKD